MMERVFLARWRMCRGAGQRRLHVGIVAGLRDMAGRRWD
jgi:hypothetical protein